MNALGENGHDRSAGLRPPRRQKAEVGLQGEALIFELQSVRRAFERNRRTTPCQPEPPRGKAGAKPEAIVRQFPRLSERIDGFDHNLLRQPIRVAQTTAERFAAGQAAERPQASDPTKLRKRKILADFGNYLQILQVQIRWVFSGSPAIDESALDFREQVVRTHEVQLKAASRVLIISAAIAGGWATLAPLAGAVMLPGTLVVESSVKKIQHPTGGVVAEIPVEDGMHVNAGALLLRLDDTQLEANQRLIADQLDQVRARTARLVAERDAEATIHVPPQLAARQNDPGIAHLVASEMSLFVARAKARQGQKDLYASNIKQFQEQIDGLNGEIQSKSAQLTLIATELKGVEELYSKSLVPLTRLTTLQRESAQLEGERAQLAATIAETNAKIGQARLQIVQIDQNFRSEVMKDLREAQDKEAELMERNVVAKDQLARVDVRAPTSGIVHQLAVHTVGGVIRAGEVIMEIVPDTDALEIEGHLPPNEIDQVERGQPAYLRFSTLDRQTMPEVQGTVTYISADLSHDERGSVGFYTVKVDLPEGERRHLDGMTLISGMPVEIFLQTGSRTMLSYLLKPITDQMRRMFKEP